jgi:hypothetical protein
MYTENSITERVFPTLLVLLTHFVTRIISLKVFIINEYEGLKERNIYFRYNLGTTFWNFIQEQIIYPKLRNRGCLVCKPLIFK